MRFRANMVGKKKKRGVFRLLHASTLEGCNNGWWRIKQRASAARKTSRNAAS